ncbi:nitroreductase family protein [Flavobacterium ustbae]|uniref:nitroreductase family protein n=1 Tax=Flavobacterium ustbae TaxID=2488790 RepID=UPI000F79B306|nr:nitroreductase family protein [Flavobacterium ustbae]
MNVKELVKRLMPEVVLNKVKILKFTKISNRFYKYDSDRFLKHSNVLTKWNNPEKLLGQIIVEYHAIEKGLAMTNMRLGFGKNVLIDLVNHCILFKNLFGTDREQFKYALRVIAEYKSVHRNEKFDLEDDLIDLIDKLLLKEEDLEPSEQISMTKESYLEHTYSSFEKFSSNRKSLRMFEGSVKIEDIEKAVSLAQNAPSACNRQPSRVYVLQEKELIKKALEVQNGNRGFGHLSDKVIVLTAELGGYLSMNERNDVYVNGGIYAMNLLYALHYYQIGACPLNWCASPEQDLKLREIFEIKESETVILMIACGGIPDNFKLVTSHKDKYKNIIKVI